MNSSFQITAVGFQQDDVLQEHKSTRTTSALVYPVCFMNNNIWKPRKNKTWLMVFGYSEFFVMKSRTSWKEFPKTRLLPSPDGWFRVQRWWSGASEGSAPLRQHCRTRWWRLEINDPGDGERTSRPSTEKCEQRESALAALWQVASGKQRVKNSLFTPALSLPGNYAVMKRRGIGRGRGGKSMWHWAMRAIRGLTAPLQGQHVRSVWGGQRACAIRWLIFAFLRDSATCDDEMERDCMS